MTASTYHFLPWAREGLASRLRPPADGEDPRRGHLSLAARFNGADLAGLPPVALLGPGDVLTLAPAPIVRTDPMPGATAFEPGFYPSLDLDSPTLPWLFTPLPPAGDRLTPWLCLVVVRHQDGVRLRVDGLRGTTILEIGPPADARVELPDLGQAWAWAHVQVAGTLAEGESLETMMATAPERVVSRLLCPTPLHPASRYQACLVPTFAVGRDAALGRPLPAGLGPAWTTADRSVTLPVYHTWEFATGQGADFASLVGALRLRPTPPGVGQRAFDVTGGGLAPPPDALSMPPFMGALCHPQAGYQPAPEWARQQLASLAGPALPLYGGEPAGRRRVTAADPGWLAELNLDPRYRAVAALGAAVVRERQEHLAAAAWRQAGDVRLANEVVGTAALASAVNGTLRARLAAVPDAGTLAQLAAPLQRTAAADVTTTTAFRQVSRRRGPFARRAAPAPPVAIPAGQVDSLMSIVDPANSVRRSVDDRVSVPLALAAQGGEELAPLTVAPSFPTPMAGELARLAPQLLLPGTGDIPPDSVVLLATNPRFVAAFLAGLTTEMAQELRWRGFPLDGTATMFQHFWDQRGQGTGPAPPDVPPIADWPPEAGLDEVVVAAAAQIVLALRGELLRRHPRTGVYAVRAQSRTALADETDPSNVCYPIFHGAVDPDLRYFGFPLGQDAARGTGADPGWFFVFQEQPTETRFGPPPEGDPLAGDGVTAAVVAQRTLRLPLRVAIHAADLLDPGTGDSGSAEGDSA